MQFPIDWYIPIIPGALYMASIFLFLVPQDSRHTFFRFIDDNRFIAAPVFFILSFIVGTAANTILVAFVRPILVDLGLLASGGVQITNEELTALYNKYGERTVSIYSVGYQNMVFLRSLFASSLVLAVVCVVKLWSNLGRTRLKRLASSVLISIVIFSLYTTWWTYRSSFLANESQHLKNAREELTTESPR